MADDVGSAWYELGARDDKLRTALRDAESDIKRAGEVGERAFATPMERATDRVVRGLDDVGRELGQAEDSAEGLGRSFQSVDRHADSLVSSFNQLNGRGPAELAEQLDRAGREAAEAVVQVHKLAAQDGGLEPTEARKYADALNEIGVEADQAIADLRELARADPEFDTAELREAADLIDQIGDEAGATADALNHMGRADTNLERLSRDTRGMTGSMDKAKLSSGGLTQSLAQLAPAAASVAAVDVSDVLEQQADATGDAADATGVLTESMGKGVNAMKAARLAVAAFTASVIGIKLIQFFGDSIDASSNLAEAQSKVNVVFGESAVEINEWAASSSTAFGQSKRSALEAAGTYGNLLQAFGVARPAAAEMSRTLVELAADLASFNNSSVEEALDALRSGLSGETEPLKRFGVAINDARLKEEALRLGLIKTATGTLPVAAKAQAAYALILKDTALAQGDFARTSDGLANQQRIWEAQLEDVSAELGDKLLPLVLQLTQFANDSLIPALRAVIDYFDTAGTSISGFVDGTVDTMAYFQIRVGDLGKEVEDRANEIGVSVTEMKELVISGMNDMGLSFEDAKTYAEQTLSGIPLASSDAALRTVAAWKQADYAGMRAATDELAGQLPESMEEAQEEAVEIARQTPAALAGGLREDIGDYQAALDEIVEMTGKSVSDAKERGTIEAILASKGIADGLNSESTRTRLETLALVEDLIADYELLAPGALSAGSLVNPSLRDGVMGNIGLATAAGNAIVDAAGNPLVEISNSAYVWGSRLSARFHAGMASHYAAIRATSIALGEAAAVGIRLRSPAKEGPLSEDAALWMGKLVDRWLSPAWAAIPRAEAASKALGGALASQLQPDVGAGLSARNGLEGAGGGRVQNFYLTFEGQQRHVTDPFAAVQEAQRMGVFEG